MKSLNFNSITKKHLTVTLNDDKGTVILVQSPTKKVMDCLINMERSGHEEKSEEQINELYNVCAEVMSRNVGKVKITKEFLEEIFDFEDIQIFLHGYMEFVSSQTQGKN